jgi:hypothetical protein
VVFLVAALAASSLLRWGTQEAKGAYGRPLLQAWFQEPAVVNAGVVPGASLTVSVDGAGPRIVAWAATSGMLSIACGRVRLTAHGATSFVVSTRGLRRHSWIVVHVGGISTPLRAWVK